MSIKAYVEELQNIQIEIKRNNIKNTEHRKRIKELEANITQYLNEKGQIGLKYQGKAIFLEQKELRPAKKKKDKEQALISFFEELGVTDPKSAYSKFQDAQKEAPIEKTTIKFKKLPKTTI
jgi:hypothetical protein